ncbi:MAG: LL-diaminopimelate aminotransferase [Candidatus Margulisiibacteriota bacterium]
MGQFKEAERLLKLPIYVFAQLDKVKAEQYAKGADLIDLGMGNPDIPPPPKVIKALVDSLKNPENHRYPSFEGAPEFKSAVASWCKKQYGIDVDPEHEVVTLIGSKEGIVHFTLAFINPGDVTLVPMPAYPAHFRGTILAGGEPYPLVTNEQNNYIPDLKNIDPAIIKRAKMLILSYPTNPTAAMAPREFFVEAVAFCKKNNLILLHDFAYAEIYFDKKNKPISMLSIPGAKDVCIEYHTTSKTFGMPGWRCGFAVGNRELIESLRKIKTNLDYGLFTAVQKAAIVALTDNDNYIDGVRETYRKRRDLFVDGINALGWNVKKPLGSMYIWMPVPKGYNSTTFTMELVEKTGIVVSPGTAFGELGEGFIRVALVTSEARIAEALARLKKANIRYNG